MYALRRNDREDRTTDTILPAAPGTQTDSFRRMHAPVTNPIPTSVFLTDEKSIKNYRTYLYFPRLEYLDLSTSVQIGW